VTTSRSLPAASVAAPADDAGLTDANRHRVAVGLLRAVAAVLAGCTGIAVVLAVVLVIADWPGWRVLIDGHALVGVVVAATFGAVGTVVLHRHPRHALGWVFLIVGWSEAVSTFGFAYATARPTPPLAGLAGLVGDRIWFPGAVAAAALVTPLFPDGMPAGGRRRLLAWAGVTVSGLAFVAVWLVDLPASDVPQWRSPLELPAPALPALEAVGNGLVLAALLCGLLGGAALFVDMRRATPADRRRLGWFFVAFLAAAVSQVFDSVSPLIPLVAWALFPIGLGVAMLRYGLYDGDRLLNRTLVSLALTLVIAGVFAFAVGLGSNLVGGEGAGAVAAAVVIALGLTPARDLVQRGVDRLLYGEPRDPYAALTRLGRQLSATLAPDDLLPVVVRAVAEALRLPYAAIRWDGETRPSAVHGTPPAATMDLPLRHAGTPVGTLTIGLPSGRARLDPVDERLLHDFAQQIGPAAYGVRLTHDLRRSRNGLARARDEERHRIRRDLHDGLGPTLAGIALGLGAARRAATTDTGRELLSALEAEVKESLEDVKRLVADLHPTALEQVGLIAALHGYADTVTIRSADSLHVSVTAPDRLQVPPEVEVAAYRIALEAITNVARHARATRCTVAVTQTDDDVVITIDDDGVGVPAVRQPGLGLRSITERATELGGTATVTGGPFGGTMVQARLPLRSGR
jgi:signal transduction histidine kinase